MIAANEAKAQVEIRDSAGIRIADNRNEPVPLGGRVSIPVSARLLSVGLNEIVLREEDPDGFINLSVCRLAPSPPDR